MSSWQKLRFLADKNYGIPIKINENELITCLYDAVITYNITKDSWIELFKYPQWICNLITTSLTINYTINCVEKIIYLVLKTSDSSGQKSTIHIIQLNLNSFQCKQSQCCHVLRKHSVVICSVPASYRHWH